MTTPETRTTIRLPADLHERLRQAAERDRRTVHAEMLHLIERGLDQDERQPRRKAG